MVRAMAQMAAGSCLWFLLAASVGCNAEKAADLALKSSNPEGHCALTIVREMNAIADYFEVANRDPFERARITHERARAIPTDTCAPEVEIAWLEVLAGLEMHAQLDPTQPISITVAQQMEREQTQRANEFIALVVKAHPDLIQASDTQHTLPAQAGDTEVVQEPEVSDPASTTALAALPLPAPDVPVLQPFLTRQGLYLPADDAEVVTITVHAPTQLKVLLQIEGDAPLDVLFLPGRVNKGQWLVDAAATDIMAPFEILAGGNADARFQGALSKRGAFRRFESDWGLAQPGDYTIVLDNTVAFTPTRGDAVVTLEVYASD